MNSNSTAKDCNAYNAFWMYWSIFLCNFNLFLMELVAGV